MAQFVRPMGLGDIPQVAEIEREAFPPPWPATNFKRELLSNKLTRYLVAYDEAPENEALALETRAPDWNNHSAGFKLGTLRFNLKRLFSDGKRSLSQRQLILGFIGLWFVVDEAHLSNIAVREDYRRSGVGEHLLIAVIDLATEENVRFITLEVRASNEAARALYRKYGFVEVGIRHGYYTDNKEDAVVMSLDGITSDLFKNNFQRLRQAHANQWGIRV